jgi:hypothetical protein
LNYIVDGGVTAEFLDVRAVCDVFESDLPGDLAVHRDDGGEFLFCEEEDLQHEMVAFVGAAAETGLTHEDEAGEQDCFKRDDGGEEREGRRIEVMEVWKRIECDPYGEENEMGEDESGVSGEGGDGVGNTLGPGSSLQELLFVPGDEIDVFL